MKKVSKVLDVKYQKELLSRLRVHELRLLLLAAHCSSLHVARAASRSSTIVMGRKFENNKLKMAKTALAYAKKASYIGKKIAMAVKAGGPDPDSNRALGLVIKEAQALNVKREIVDRNIKAASSDKDSADFKELTYDAE